MSLLTRAQLGRARKVLAYGHCPTVACDCANCTAVHTLQVYERLLGVLERREAVWRTFGDDAWLKLIARELEIE